MKIKDRVLLAFDFLVAHPDGVTMEEIAADQGTSMALARKVIRQLRAWLGEDEDYGYNVVAEPDPASADYAWRYRFAGNLDDARWWLANRIGDAESRLRTMQAVVAPIARVTDGRTTEGRRARLMNRALTRLVEDLDDLSMNGAASP